MKRIFAMLLTVAMVLSMVPAQAFATEPTEETAVETTAETTVETTVETTAPETTAAETVETTAPATVPTEEIPETTTAAEVTIPETEAETAEPTEEATLPTETEGTVEETVSVMETEEAVGDPMVDGTDDSYDYPTYIQNGQTLSGSVSDNSSFVNGSLVMDKNDWFSFYLSKTHYVSIQVSSSSSPTVVLFDQNGNNIGSGANLNRSLSAGRYTVCVQNRKTSGTTYYTISLNYCAHTDYYYSTKPATCYTDGYIEYTCNSCGETWTEVIPAGHTPGTWTIEREPTCTVEGRETAWCSGCNNRISRSIAVLPHTYGDAVVRRNPTCQQTGISVRSCVACGLEQEETLEKLPHKMGQKVLTLAPAYNAKGSHSGSCVNCGTALTESIRAFTSEYGTYAVEEDVVAIGNKAFYDNDTITDVTIPGSVKTIGANAFSNCTYLKTVVMAEGVTSIGNNAFDFCQRLTSVTIPNSVTKIGACAFITCTSLANVVIPEGVTSIENYTFHGCANLTNVTLPGSITKIGVLAFWGCRKLADIDIPYGVTTIGDHAFYGCESLTSVTIPDSVETIGEAAFMDCSGLVRISLPAGLSRIVDSMFYGCYSLASIVIPETVTSIDYNAFGYCKKLTSITIPASVKNIVDHAFIECINISKVFFLGNAPATSAESIPFWHVGSSVVTAYYPYGNGTWTTEAKDALANRSNLEWKFCYHSFAGATCSEPAVCSNCGAQGSYAPHNYADATCVKPQTCTECAKTTGKPLGHSFTKYTSNGDATCTQDGTKTAKCDRCRETKTVADVGSALGHVTVTLPRVEPTCTDTGLTEGQKCTRCKEVLVAQEVIPALGHDEIIDDYVAPTCLETGLTEGKHCGRCAEVLIAQEVIPELGHAEVTDAAVEPDCTHVGYTEGSHCERCAYVFVAQEVIPALGHVEVIDAYLAPNCTEDGITEGKHCDRCGEILIAQEVIPANGHDYDVGICMTCGFELPSEYQLFAGKSLNIKITNPATGKPYTAKQLTWTLDERFEPFATMKNGKLTAKKVVERARIEIVGTVVATEEEIRYFVDIYPAVTQLEVKKNGEIVNGKTVLMDFSEETLVMNAEIFPKDVIGTVTWTVSDSKKQYASYEIDGNTLTIANPTGKAGTVTIKATITAGVKKTVTVKVQFGSFAKTVEIVEPTKTTLRGGESLQLFGYIADPKTVTKPGVVWSVSDKTAATISGGKVTAKNVAHPTLVTITATSKDGQASASVKLKIVPKNEGQLVLLKGEKFVTNGTLALNYGETCQLTAAVITNGEPVAQNAVWTTTKSNVAYVAGGLVTATGVGAAKVTAEYNGQKAVINVKVGTLVEDMELTTKDGKNIIDENGERIVIVSSGKAVSLVANVTAGANKAVTWEITEGAQYAKIATSGKLTANKDLTSVQYITVKATAKDGSGTNATIRVKILPLATGVQIYQNGTRVRSNTVFVVDMLTTPTVKLNAKVYPAKANQAVQLTSSNKKIADFNENGDLVCFKPGTVTITAKALDGSNAKTTFKLTVIKRISSLTLKDGANLTVIGGKTLKLAPMVQISPNDATNKKLTWSVAPNDYGIKISSTGVLSTKKVTSPVTVNVMVTTKDGSGLLLSFDVTVYPV